MSFRPALAATVRRPVTLVVLVLTVLAVLAGSTAYALTGKTVALSIDGQVTEVDFRGATVADALRAAELTVGEHDQLVPAADTEVADGDRVALRRGRPLQLVVDGQERTVWVTALDVDEALDQLDLRQEGLVLSASRSRSIPLAGLSLEVSTPKALTVQVDGVLMELTSPAPNVGEALAEAGITVDELDRVTPAADQPVTPGLAVQVQRVRVEDVVSTVALDFPIERRDDPELAKGKTKTLQAGEEGALRRTVRTTLVDGVVAEEQVLGEERVSEPVARIVAVGTKAPAPRAAAPAPSAPSSPRRSTGGADSLNWPALAQCESGGNPRAVNPSGKYHGLYQFSQQTWNGVGGSGVPSQASPDEQTYRAKLLYNRSGAGQWPSCGPRLFS